MNTERAAGRRRGAGDAGGRGHWRGRSPGSLGHWTKALNDYLIIHRNFFIFLEPRAPAPVPAPGRCPAPAHLSLAIQKPITDIAQIALVY